MSVLKLAGEQKPGTVLLQSSKWRLPHEEPQAEPSVVELALAQEPCGAAAGVEEQLAVAETCEAAAVFRIGHPMRWAEEPVVETAVAAA